MSKTKKVATAIWLAGFAWFAFALVAVGHCPDSAGATIGGISGLVSLIGGNEEEKENEK